MDGYFVINLQHLKLPRPPFFTPHSIIEFISYIPICIRNQVPFSSHLSARLPTTTYSTTGHRATLYNASGTAYVHNTTTDLACSPLISHSSSQSLMTVSPVAIIVLRTTILPSSDSDGNGRRPSQSNTTSFVPFVLLQRARMHDVVERRGYTTTHMGKAPRRIWIIVVGDWVRVWSWDLAVEMILWVKAWVVSCIILGWRRVNRRSSLEW